MDPRVAAFVHYYAREGWPHQVQAVCSEANRQRRCAVAQFWRAYGLLAARSTAEAMRELQAVQAHAEVQPAATAALLAAHQSAKVQDHDAVARLSARIEVEERNATGPAALHLAAFLLYSHGFERARALLERELRGGPTPAADPAAARTSTLLGFVLLEQQAQELPELRDGGEVERALQLFDSVLQQDPGDLEHCERCCWKAAPGPPQSTWRRWRLGCNRRSRTTRS